MTAVLDILVPILAGIAAVTGIYFLIHTFSDRSHESRAAYTVGRQRARHEKQVDLVWAIFLFMVAIILLGVFGFAPRPVEPVPTATPIPTVVPATAVPPTIPSTQFATATTAVTPSPTALLTGVATFTPSPTSIPQTAVPTSTATPQPQTATVTSGVGVWLRSQPGTDSEQLEWLLEGTIVTVLAETATGENLAWQQVQTGEGLVGWVAVPFITYNQ